MGYKYQMHSHTAPCSGCARASMRDMLTALKDGGYQGMVITNHFFRGNTGIPRENTWEDFVGAYEKDYLEGKEIGKELDLDVLFGVEEGIGGGKEILVYGLTPQMLYDHPELRNSSLETWYTVLHPLGVVILQAHPFRRRGYITQAGPADAQFLDGYEIWNYHDHPLDQLNGERFAKNVDAILIAGADAHNGLSVCKAGIEASVRIKNEAQLAAVLKKREFTPIPYSRLDADYDLIVVGAGFSGVCAATQAARRGLKVLLIDKNNSAGGAVTSNLVTPFMRYWTEINGKRTFLSDGLFTEILDQMRSDSAMLDWGTVFDTEQLKLVMNRLLLSAGVTPLFDSYLSAVEVKENVIRSVSVANKSGVQTFRAPYFIDATGDGDLAALADCPYTLGRELDHQCQPMTLCFRIGPVDQDAFWRELPEMQKTYKAWQEEGKIKNPRENILAFNTMTKGVIHLNTTRVIRKSPINAQEKTLAEIEAREQAFELMALLKTFPSCRDASILQTAAEIGVRESRMIHGQYVLTQEDLLACRHFEDGIAACNYDIDIHSPDGSGTSHYYFENGDYYTIPYRCLLPVDKENLLVTGRCISATHEAQASLRIMPVCACLGQAAGEAAAMAKEAGVSPREVDTNKLRENLRACGAFVGE